MTTPHAGSAPWMGLRRFAVVAVVLVAFVVVGALAGWLFVSSQSSVSSPSRPDRSIYWTLSAAGSCSNFDPTTAYTATVIPVLVPIPECSPPDDSWLAPPAITYTPSAVIITMHTSDAFEEMTNCYATVNGRRSMAFWLDSYTRVPVHLGQALAGRALMDGSTDPPTRRYSWSDARPSP